MNEKELEQASKKILDYCDMVRDRENIKCFFVLDIYKKEFLDKIIVNEKQKPTIF
jgi:hypothetical protein